MQEVFLQNPFLLLQNRNMRNTSDPDKVSYLSIGFVITFWKTKGEVERKEQNAILCSIWVEALNHMLNVNHVLAGG